MVAPPTMWPERRSSNESGPLRMVWPYSKGMAFLIIPYNSGWPKGYCLDFCSFNMSSMSSAERSKVGSVAYMSTLPVW